MESQTTKSAQVIVVGAGVSGLQAAYRIQQSGASCLVLEATNRIGGQAFFNSSFNPVNHPRTYDLAKRLQLVSEHQNRQENLVGDVVSQLNDDDFQSYTRTLSSIDDLSMEINLNQPELSMAHYENMTAQELAVSKGATPAVQKIVDLWTRSIFGASSANVSAIHFLTHCKSCDGLINAVDVLACVGQNLHTEDAAHKICQQLAGYLQQSSIQTRQQVVQIEQVADNNCVVTTHTGNVYECAKVILAGSSAMCKNITIFPALSQEKSWVQTAEEHGFRTTVQVLFDHPWWQERNLSGFAQGIDGPIVQVTPANSGIHELYALTCAIAGEDARSMWTWSMGDDEREDAICTHLRSIFGGNIPRAVLVVEQQANALVAGEQSLNVPFANMLDMSVDQWKSEGNIHFSGADTSFVWRGHIEGALNAGDRAASEVVTALGGEVAVELGARL